MSDREQDLARQISETLERVGLYVGVEQDPNSPTITLLGEVDSDESRQAAIDVATALAGADGLTVDDQLEVISFSPDDAFGDSEQNASELQLTAADDTSTIDADERPVVELEPDFSGDVGTTDVQLVIEEGQTYFAPTDPVVRPVDGAEELEIVGGFEETAIDDDDDTDVSGRRRNDDDIADDVRRELIGDALTTDLDVRVAVLDGTVILMGSVPSIDDAENAEAVASRVAGIVEIREELTIDPDGR